MIHWLGRIAGCWLPEVVPPTGLVQVSFLLVWPGHSEVSQFPGGYFQGISKKEIPSPGKVIYLDRIWNARFSAEGESSISHLAVGIHLRKLFIPWANNCRRSTGRCPIKSEVLVDPYIIASGLFKPELWHISVLRETFLGRAASSVWEWFKSSSVCDVSWTEAIFDLVEAQVGGNASYLPLGTSCNLFPLFLRSRSPAGVKWHFRRATLVRNQS